MSIEGGFLICVVCHRLLPLGDLAAYERDGWPKHCGSTMVITAGRESLNVGPRE